MIKFEKTVRDSEGQENQNQIETEPEKDIAGKKGQFMTLKAKIACRLCVCLFNQTIKRNINKDRTFLSRGHALSIST